LTWSYARRPRTERGALQAEAEAVERDSRRRKVIKIMGQTIAESLMEEGELRAYRHALLQLLKIRFKKVPKTVKDRIEQMTDIKLLMSAHSQAAQVKKLDDLQL
jgi:hypothetical protein